MMRPCPVAFIKERIMHTRINWFEIPAVNLSRATQFYETICMVRTT
jgi:predicted enzyme related to lactoylglutathione lyase